MREASNLWGKWRNNIAFSLTAAVVVVGDQLSKAWIRSNLALGEVSPEGEFLFFTHIRNTGATFGIFRGYTLQLTIIGFVAIGVVLFYAFYLARRYPPLNNLMSKSALGMVLGGAIGNVIDRVSLGYITDFVGVGSWPPYNIADAFMTAGVITFVGSLFRIMYYRKKARAKA